MFPTVFSVRQFASGQMEYCFRKAPLVGTIVVSITDAIDKASMIFDFAGYGCSTSVEMSCDIRK